MAPALLENESNSTTFMFDEVEWPEKTGYPCHVSLVREDDGQISAFVLNLPGAASCGDTESEALENVKESVRGLIEVYQEHGDPIPWTDYRSDDIPDGATTKWILENVQQGA